MTIPRGTAASALLVVAITAGGCGSSGRHAGEAGRPQLGASPVAAAVAAPTTVAPTATSTTGASTVPAAVTVLGMHYTQMERQLEPLLARLSAVLTAPPPATVPRGEVAAALAAIAQFDAAVPNLPPPPGSSLAAADALVRADVAVAADLDGVPQSGVIAPQLGVHLRSDLATRAAADRALQGSIGGGTGG